jgi:hypothetical protein
MKQDRSFALQLADAKGFLKLELTRALCWICERSRAA